MLKFIIYKSLLFIKVKSNNFLLFLFKKLFFCQNLLYVNNKLISRRTYTYMYITLILNKMGLIAPINRKFGF